MTDTIEWHVCDQMRGEYHAAEVGEWGLDAWAEDDGTWRWAVEAAFGIVTRGRASDRETAMAAAEQAYRNLG